MVDGVRREQEVPISLPNGTHSARAVTHAFFYVCGTLGTKMASVSHRKQRKKSRETREEREREIGHNKADIDCLVNPTRRIACGKERPTSMDTGVTPGLLTTS